MKRLNRKSEESGLLPSAAVWKTEASREPKRIRLSEWLLSAALMLLSALGCKHQIKQDSPQVALTTQAVDGEALALDASPAEVGQAALVAIATRDKVALQKLVAVKKVKQDVAAIAGGRSAFQGMVDKAIPTAVGAIISEINWLDPEGREIDQETMTGDTALVTVKGKRNGQEHSRRLFFVKEDHQWRLVPSHR